MLIPLTAVVLSACAATHAGTRAVAEAQTDHADEPAATTIALSAPDADRQAILAMLGEYHVRFDFRETVILAEGYQRAEPQSSGAYELVVLITDEPERIVLQHLLVSREGGHVTKHWRQDWHWQARQRLEYSDDQTWRVRDIPLERQHGAWTQCVFEVSDAPRYCGTGRWNHRYGVATWTSDRSWRPLPRREHTKREDYNALNVENRHTIVPGGWTHEQDNTKTMRDHQSASRTLVREVGFNDYERLPPGQFDFSPAHQYWQATQGYWALVRAEWDRRIASAGGVYLDMPISGMPFIIETFQQADRVVQGEIISDAELRQSFDQHVKAPAAEGISQTPR